MPDPFVPQALQPFQSPPPNTAEVAALRERSRDYARRSAVLHRDDDAKARHTEDVWSSRAASASRAELQRGVGFSVWMAADGLRDTHVALDDHAAYLERESRRLDREADALESGPPPLMGFTTSSNTAGYAS